MKTILILLLRGYQKFISPFFAPKCKYYPSCSQYSIDAIREYGSLRGIAMTGWRLLRCNPFSHGGVDYAKDPYTPHTPKKSSPDPVRTKASL